MEKTITKHSDTEVTISTPHDDVVSVSDLKGQLLRANDDFVVFEAWVIEERAGRQAIIDDLATTLKAASDLGVADVAQTISNEKTP